ncbi:hypothetical protein [Asticcacaulis sp. 201]|uniref:hypothetical protein n=1 Tax=Asticcacaulis sp. 201 TaxID=3028787 RepID=UPI002916D17D|nr:hypothetical protein [Asticcacaulis sp. 201]MDV6332010.1 hypothetical protein [Asticcacaulis sp. 201]
MSSSTTSYGEGVVERRKPGPAGFLMLTVLAMGVAAFALYKGDAPLYDPHIEDWIDQARISPVWAALFAAGIFLFVIGLIGVFRSLFSAGEPKPRRLQPSLTDDIELEAAPAIDIQTATRASDGRGNLRFTAETIGMQSYGAESRPMAVEPPSVETNSVVEAPVQPVQDHAGRGHDIQSLEPAIFTDHAAFSDNASDTFMTRQPETAAPGEVPRFDEVPMFDSAAALSETHGLQITSPTAQIIPLRPETVVETTHDPLEAALLRETPDVVTQAPPGDINAVINSAMRFAPQSDIAGHPAVTDIPAVAPEVVTDVIPAAVSPVPTLAEPVPTETLIAQPVIAEPAVIDDEAEIRQAVQTALSVWPDATRAIAADELSTRISHLYYDKSPQAVRAFQLIASGDLSAASTALANHADALAVAGNHAGAAELWRIAGALHMGRDDTKAMAAYEHVSELDPLDANIHLYLARRYQMAGDTVKQPPVISRALGVISDPATRAELLAPYADLKLKAGDAKAAGDALEELSRLHETNANLRPDDVGVRSTYALTLARFAQAREMQGAYDQAGPLYKKAQQVFADLSAMKPEHPGLRAMAENALKDAQRFNMA